MPSLTLEKLWGSTVKEGARREDPAGEAGRGLKECRLDAPLPAVARALPPSSLPFLPSPLPCVDGQGRGQSRSPSRAAQTMSLTH